MENSGLALLESFQKQKVSQESEVLQEAQRFVNQYRSLRYFDSSYIHVFNSQLLACQPNVRRFFTSIMGGNEVLSYLEFLEKQQPKPSSENGEDSSQLDIATDGYLPLPESDLISEAGTGMISVPKEEWVALKEQQRILMEQTNQLLHQLKNQRISSSGTAVSGDYSEIVSDEN